MPERPLPSRDATKPLHFFELPPDITEFLQTQETACLMQATDHGTIFVIKLPSRELAGLRGNMSIQVIHELWMPPQAPVIRTALRLPYPAQSHPALATFTNVADLTHTQNFATLIYQRWAPLLVYDEQMVRQITRTVTHGQGEHALQLLHQARLYKGAIPDEQFDFVAAKQAVIEATILQ